MAGLLHAIHGTAGAGGRGSSGGASAEGSSVAQTLQDTFRRLVAAPLGVEDSVCFGQPAAFDAEASGAAGEGATAGGRRGVHRCATVAVEAGDLVTLMGLFAQALQEDDGDGEDNEQDVEEAALGNETRREAGEGSKDDNADGDAATEGEEDEEKEEEEEEEEEEENDDDDDDKDGKDLKRGQSPHSSRRTGPTGRNAYLYDPRIFNAVTVQQACVPGGNALATASGLARIFAALGNGGVGGDLPRRTSSSAAASAASISPRSGRILSRGAVRKMFGFWSRQRLGSGEEDEEDDDEEEDGARADSLGEMRQAGDTGNGLASLHSRGSSSSNNSSSSSSSTGQDAHGSDVRSNDSSSGSQSSKASDGANYGASGRKPPTAGSSSTGKGGPAAAASDETAAAPTAANNTYEDDGHGSGVVSDEVFVEWGLGVQRFHSCGAGGDGSGGSGSGGFGGDGGGGGGGSGATTASSRGPSPSPSPSSSPSAGGRGVDTLSFGLCGQTGLALCHPESGIALSVLVNKVSEDSVMAVCQSVADIVFRDFDAGPAPHLVFSSTMPPAV